MVSLSECRNEVLGIQEVPNINSIALSGRRVINNKKMKIYSLITGIVLLSLSVHTQVSKAVPVVAATECQAICKANTSKKVLLLQLEIVPKKTALCQPKEWFGF